eukprot:5894338-Amphidinium_carterae.2
MQASLVTISGFRIALFMNRNSGWGEVLKKCFSSLSTDLVLPGARCGGAVSGGWQRINAIALKDFKHRLTETHIDRASTYQLGKLQSWKA